MQICIKRCENSSLLKETKMISAIFQRLQLGTVIAINMSRVKKEAF